jgi:hypothetical protein
MPPWDKRSAGPTIASAYPSRRRHCSRRSRGSRHSAPLSCARARPPGWPKRGPPQAGWPRDVAASAAGAPPVGAPAAPASEAQAQAQAQALVEAGAEQAPVAVAAAQAGVAAAQGPAGAAGAQAPAGVVAAAAPVEAAAARGPLGVVAAQGLAEAAAAQAPAEVAVAQALATVQAPVGAVALAAIPPPAEQVRLAQSAQRLPPPGRAAPATRPPARPPPQHPPTAAPTHLLLAAPVESSATTEPPSGAASVTAAPANPAFCAGGRAPPAAACCLASLGSDRAELRPKMHHCPIDDLSADEADHYPAWWCFIQLPQWHAVFPTGRSPSPATGWTLTRLQRLVPTLGRVAGGIWPAKRPCQHVAFTTAQRALRSCFRGA